MLTSRRTATSLSVPLFTGSTSPRTLKLFGNTAGEAVVASVVLLLFNSVRVGVDGFMFQKLPKKTCNQHMYALKSSKV